MLHTIPYTFNVVAKVRFLFLLTYQTSIKSKSTTKFMEAITITNKLNPMLYIDELFTSIKGIPESKIDIPKFTAYN